MPNALIKTNALANKPKCFIGFFPDVSPARASIMFPSRAIPIERDGSPSFKGPVVPGPINERGNFLSYEVADTFEIGFAPRRQRANGL